MRSVLQRWRIAWCVLVAVAAWVAPGESRAQSVDDALREVGESIHRAASAVIDAVHADLDRLQQSWKAGLAGKPGYHARSAATRAIEAADIDAACETARAEMVESRARVEAAYARYRQSTMAAQAAGSLNADGVANHASLFIRETEDAVYAAISACWESHENEAGFGLAFGIGRASVIAAEAQQELDDLAESLTKEGRALAAKANAGEIDGAAYWDGVNTLRDGARQRVDAILKNEARQARLREIRDSLDPARMALSRIWRDWTVNIHHAVQPTRDLGVEWSTTMWEGARDQAVRLLDLNHGLPGDPRPYVVYVRPTAKWTGDLQDLDAPGEVLGGPLVFETSVTSVFIDPAAEGAPAAAELPRPVQDLPPRPLAARLCAARVVDQTAHDSAAGATRTLCLYGIGLMNDAGTVKALTESDDFVSYDVLAVRAGSFNIDPAEPYSALWRAGIDSVSKDIPPSAETGFCMMDAVLVKATIAPGAMPGFRSLRIGEGECAWMLDAATASAELEFVRLLPWTTPDIVDRPDEFFVFDSMCVQVTTSVPLEVDQISLIVLRNRQPITFTGDAAAVNPSGEAGVVIAHQLEGHPTIYRTRSFLVDNAGRPTPPDRLEDFAIATGGADGDVFWATTDGHFFAAPVADSVAILQSPDRLKTINNKGTLFSEAIRDAALIHDLELASLDVNDEQIVDTISHTYPAELRVHEIQFSVADHAAMLLLKRTFLRMAGDYLAQLKGLASSDASIRAHIPDMIAQMQDGAAAASEAGDTRVFSLGFRNRIQFPVGVRGVPREYLTEYGMLRWREGDGFSILLNAFNDEGPRFFVNRSDFLAWQFECTKEALRLQIEATQAAIDYANEVDDEEVDELLDFTGRGFEPIVDRIIPRLLEFQQDPANQRFRWVPHQKARVLVTDLTNTLFENEIAARGARASQEAMLAIVTGCGLGLSGNLLGKAILAATAAVSIGYAGADVVALETNKNEVQFASDAVAIIGRDRLIVDLRDRNLSPTPYVMVALAAFGFRCDVADLVRGVQLSVARQATQRALADVADEGLPAWSAMTLDEHLMASALFEEVRLARAAGQPLTPAQEVVARAMTRIESDMFVKHPWGWPTDESSDLIAANADSASGVRPLVGDTTQPPAGNPARPPAPPPGAVDELTLPPSGAADEATLPPPVRDEAANPPAAEAPTLPPPSPDLPLTRRHMRHEDIPDGMPLPGYSIRDPETGEVFVVGGPLGKGAYATTYELFDSAGKPTGKVIKFLRQPWNENTADYLKRMHDAGGNERKFYTHVPWDPTELPYVVDRMMHGQKLLEEAGIPHLRMVTTEQALGRAGRDADIPYVIQDIIPDTENFKRFDVGTSLIRDHQRAVAVLYKKMADKGLVWKDGHIQNIYFERVGDEWIAGVLDPDMIVKFDAGFTNAFLAKEVLETLGIGHLKGIASMPLRENLKNIPLTPNIAKLFVEDAHAFMAKMFEHRAWVIYERYSDAERAASGVAGEFIRNYIDPAIVREVFGDLNQWVRLP